ncbi:uncharacterized protein [Narcine bancroftii]|uniref:uncharacterized protein isoform X3 n=1 Tax=Narcine bancroftii TaxID=1343680 RepID=UPI0038315CF0
MFSPILSGFTLFLCAVGVNVPVLIQSPSLERITEGHTARLCCAMQNAWLEKTDVHWYRELPGQGMEWVLTHEAGGATRRRANSPERFEPSRDVSNSSFILMVSDVEPGDSAVYYCVVWGDISGNGTRLIVTDPLDDPVLTQYPAVSQVPEGVTVQMQCTLDKANVSNTDVHWYWQRPGHRRRWAMSHFVNEKVTKSFRISDRFQPFRNVTSNSYVLNIANASINDTATYNCSVWNYIYGAGTQLNVTDAMAPVLIQSPSLEKVTEGQTTRLWCHMKNAGVGNTDVHWYRKLAGQEMDWVLTQEAGGATRRRPNSTERLQPSRDVSNSSFILTVTDVEPLDSAVYYCVVWGDISGDGSRLNVIRLDDKRPSSMVGIITACLLVLGLLFCILATAVCYMKKCACFQHRFKPDGSSTEDLKTISATIAVDPKENKDAATDVSESEKSEIHYADVQFHRRTAKDSTVRISEETTEYAVIQRA